MTNIQDNVPNTTNVDFSGQSNKTPKQVSTDDSPPMAVLPLNSSAKLDQEPNPFEQSFSTVTAPSERPSHQQQHSYDNNNNKRSESLSSSSTSTTTSNSSNNGNNQHQKTILPPVAAIASPVPPLLRSGVLPKDVANQIAWNSLRAGPLSPSMLQGPQKHSSFEVTTNNNNMPSTSSPSYSPLSSNNSTIVIASLQQQQQQVQHRQSHHNQRPMSHIYAPDPALSFAMAGPAVDEVAQNDYVNARSSSISSSASATSISPTATTHKNLMNSNHDDRRPSEPMTMKSKHDTNLHLYQDNNNNDNDNSSNDNTIKTKKRARSTSNTDKDEDEDDKKRKNFLERNRIAALKCRQRKKQWLNNLQARVEYLTNDNEQLQVQSNVLREEIVNLKTLLLAHKDCPIAQQQQQGVFHELQQEHQQQHNQHHYHHHHNQNKSSPTSSRIHPSGEPEVIPIRYSSTTSSTPNNNNHSTDNNNNSNNNNNNNNNTTNNMQQNMMTFSSHPQAQSMVAGTSSVLRF